MHAHTTTSQRSKMKHARIPSLRGRFLLANAVVVSAFATAAACSDNASLPPATDDGIEAGPTEVFTKDASSDAHDGASDGEPSPSETDAAPNDAGGDAGDAADGDVTGGEAPPNGRCREPSNCTDPKLGCFSYEEPNCDPANANYCQADEDCAEVGPNLVCGPARKGCAASCIPECQVNADCPLGYGCGVLDAHHCSRTPCNTSADCPNTNFTCQATNTGGLCGRRECTKDNECDGRCVKETNGWVAYCIEDWGFCTAP